MKGDGQTEFLSRFFLPCGGTETLLRVCQTECPISFASNHKKVLTKQIKRLYSWKQNLTCAKRLSVVLLIVNFAPEEYHLPLLKYLALRDTEQEVISP